MSKFELYNDKSKPSEFRFRLKARGNHEVIGKSEGYTTKQSAKTGIDSVKANSLDRENFTVEPTTDSKYFWNLFAQNGEIVLSASETYESKQGAEIGIKSVMTNAPKAEVIDLTKPKQSSVKIIINGKTKTVDSNELSFDELVELAFPNQPANPNTAHTITYKRGCDCSPEGSLVKSESVCIKDGGVFNVTATDKS